MCSSNQFQIVRVVELFRDLLTEGITVLFWKDTPDATIIWVGPEKITDGSFVWHFHDSIKLLDLIKSVNFRGETAMYAENTALDNCG